MFSCRPSRRPARVRWRQAGNRRARPTTAKPAGDKARPFPKEFLRHDRLAISTPRRPAASAAPASAPPARRAAGVRVFAAGFHVGCHDHADRFFPTGNSAMVGLHVPVMIVVLVLAVLVLLSRAGRWPIAVMVGVVFVVRVRIAISIQSRLGDGRPLVLAAFRPPATFAAAATTAPTPRTAFFVQLSGLGCRLAATSLAALLVGELLVVIRSFDVRRSVVHEFEFLVARF